MQQENKRNLTLLLKVAGLSRSTYYFEINKKDSDEKNALICERIREVFNAHHCNYGVRRIYHQLINQGLVVNHKKVQRLMNKMGLTARKHKQKYHSYQGTIGPIAKNELQRNFVASKPNQKWTTDVSQFSFRWGKCYLSPIMDMFNNEIISYDLSLSPNFEQIERMLSRAKIEEKDVSNLIFHSDQGWQYQNPRYVKFLKEKGIKQSMSRKGNCFDNVIMESFFGVMKNEIFYGHEYEYHSFSQFLNVVDKYMFYYNNERIKEKTNWMSPVKYRESLGFIT